MLVDTMALEAPFIEVSSSRREAIGAPRVEDCCGLAALDGDSWKEVYV